MGNEGLIERDLTRRVIGAFHEVYNELGAGFLEQVYETSLALALRESGCRVLQQVGLDVFFRAHKVGEYRADFWSTRGSSSKSRPSTISRPSTRSSWSTT